MGCPGGHEHDPMVKKKKYSLSIYARFSGQFFLKFCLNEIAMGKKIVVPCLDVIMITVLSRNIWWKSIPVSSEVRFCSCKEPRPLATWTRLLSRKGFKVNKNAKVCSNHFKFCGRPVDSHPHPTFFLKGYYREIVTRKRKAPIDRLPVQPIRTEKKKSDTDSIQREKKRNNIVDTPKKLLWSFTVVFIGKKAIIITSKLGTTIFFPITILF